MFLWANRLSEQTWVHLIVITIHRNIIILGHFIDSQSV